MRAVELPQQLGALAVLGDNSVLSPILIPDPGVPVPSSTLQGQCTHMVHKMQGELSYTSFFFLYFKVIENFTPVIDPCVDFVLL